MNMYSPTASWSSSDPNSSRSRASSSPELSPPSRQKPYVLMSRYVPSTVHSPDLFFCTPMPVRHPRHSTSVPPVPILAHPPFKRAMTSTSDLQKPPELPPKLPLPFPLSEEPIPVSPIHDDELEAVLALSRSEIKKQNEFLEKLSSQEEEDLARALEESKLSQSSMNSYTSAFSQGSPTFYTNEAGPSRSPSLGKSPTPPSGQITSVASVEADSQGNDICIEDQLSGPTTPEDFAHTPRMSSFLQPSGSGPWSENSQLSDDEAFARKLMEEEERLSAGPSSSVEDEALARKLAAEEEEEARHARANHDTKPSTSTDPQAFPSSLPGLPTYADATSPPPPNSPPSSSLSSADQNLSVQTNLIRNSSSGSISSYASSSDPSANSLNTSPGSSPVPPVASNGQADDAVLNINQYVDKDLLQGVSVGFIPPTITYSLEPMQGVMPNIISLPYGRCPPLHIQAPTWRHMLKLMAWLSGTRIEPTVEAMAVSKAEALHLRTVVQFIKPSPVSPEWRTVLWFTIDHPVPPSMPGARKYTNNDVDVLPFSYTLSTIPALLRDSTDTPVSKTYSITATESLPYPPLPITFPNLAMYLQAALDESRRYMSDSSSGIRKLAKMVDLCYPNSREPELAGGLVESRSGMGGLIKKVWGRGNKNNKKGRGGNEETYELVTPFVPDQWG